MLPIPTRTAINIPVTHRNRSFEILFMMKLDEPAEFPARKDPAFNNDTKESSCRQLDDGIATAALSIWINEQGLRPVRPNLFGF